MLPVPVRGLPKTMTVRGSSFCSYFSAAAAWSRRVKTIQPFDLMASSNRWIVSATELLLATVTRPGGSAAKPILQNYYTSPKERLPDHWCLHTCRDFPNTVRSATFGSLQETLQRA